MFSYYIVGQAENDREKEKTDENNLNKEYLISIVISGIVKRDDCDEVNMKLKTKLKLK